MLISIIVPVYNVEKYLEECLESILQQDFLEYEVICVNDDSTDRSAEILKKYEMEYNQIKVIEHSQNMGLSAARNTAMLHATGKYIMFVDSDDMIVTNILKELYKTSELNQLDMLYFNRSYLYDNISEYKAGYQRESAVNIDSACVSTGKELFCSLVENNQYTSAVWRRFFRRDFLLENDFTFQEGILHEDVVFSFLCAMKAKRVLYINKELYIYRQREHSIMHTYSDYRTQSMFWILIQIFTYWNANEFTERENHAIAMYFKEQYNSFLYSRNLGKLNTELKLGTYAEKALYNILYGKKENKWLTLSKNQIEIIKKSKNVIVYGAGIAAEEIIRILKNNNIRINQIAVDNVKENPAYLCGIKVMDFRMLETYKDNSVIIIGVSRKYSDGIKETLERFGFKNIIVAEAIKQ